MKKYDVQCPHCCGVFLETNGHFREDKPANGAMFTAKQHIIDAGWTVFPLYDSTEYDNITCPSCYGVLVDGLGKVIRLQAIGEVEEITTEGEMRKRMDALVDEYEPELPTAKISIDGAKIIDDILNMPAVKIQITATEHIDTKSIVLDESEKVIHSVLAAVNASTKKKPGRPKKA